MHTLSSSLTLVNTRQSTSTSFITRHWLCSFYSRQIFLGSDLRWDSTASRLPFRHLDISSFFTAFWRLKLKCFSASNSHWKHLRVSLNVVGDTQKWSLYPCMWKAAIYSSVGVGCLLLYVEVDKRKFLFELRGSNGCPDLNISCKTICKR